MTAAERFWAKVRKGPDCWTWTGARGRRGTRKDNSRDMVAKGRHGRYRAKWTHCPRGHAFTAENTYQPPGTSYRTCRTCKRDRERRSAAASA